MHRMQIQLEQEQLAQLRALAAAEGVSLSELVRRAVDGLTARAPAASPSDRKTRARAAVGAFRSGRHDVSRTHDDHLADAYAGRRG